MDNTNYSINKRMCKLFNTEEINIRQLVYTNLIVILYFFKNFL